ncbi:MAG: metal-dependent transcriptional regulator [Chlorobi bacterium]|nr:metal-dependent transcriptional regulator [Chlorobiota bacterium]
MNSPVILLLLGVLILALPVFLFHPKKGLIALLKRYNRDAEKEKIENALKHIYDCEYREHYCSLESIAGNLGVTSDKSSSIFDDLEKRNLALTGNEGIKLTAEGRDYALRLVRIHRLWERYLADETGVDPDQWHIDAEEKEHDLVDSANEIAEKIGNPVVDPHGDPIPDKDGQIFKLEGKSPLDLERGEIAKIVHIEDEPDSIYAQLMAQGLYKGMQIQIVEKNDGKIVFSADGKEVVLASSFANNLTVAPITAKEEIKESFQTLDLLEENQEAEVVGFSGRIRGQQKRRLMDLGIIPGTKIKALLKSPFNDPVAYLIRGTTIALRKDQSEGIFIKYA